jgi:glycosyltransferase involved in cell wall biosynthesis
MLLLPDAQFLWILTALPFALWKQRHCQVIYSSAWPLSCHVLGLLVHNLTGKPWVADYRDEWTLNTQWFPPTRFHRWLGEKLDAACVRNARFVVNTTEIRTRNFMEKFGGTLDKYVTIHNGFDEQDVAPYRGLAPPGEILTITSIGSLYGGRDPRLLLSVLSELVQKGTIHKERICLKLIGGENEVLQHEVQQLGIASCVEIIPRLPQPQAFEHLAKSHIALLIGSDMERYAMTTKLYEYAGMGRKIMALVPEGPVWDFVTQSGGVCAMFNDRGQIEQALIQIFEEFKAGRLNVNVQPIQAYERKNLTAQQTELFNRCLFSKEKE